MELQEKTIETGISTDTRANGQRTAFLLFCGLVCAYCVWVLSLPLFPSQDGPIHLYYAWILSHLFSGSEFLSQYFAFRHPVPPYLVHYLLLAFLMKLSSPILAEKIVVCLILAAFSFGFRFLITTISRENGPTFAFLAVPLSLSWSLGMGFHNYCLSLALSFVAIALWLRGSATDRSVYRLAFLLTCAVMLFTHPIPLMMTLLVVACEMLLRIVKLYLSSGRVLGAVLAEPSLRRDLIFAGLAFCSMAYIALFVNRTRTAENMHHKLIQGGMLLDFVKAKPLTVVFGNLWSRLYCVLLFCILGGCLWASFRRIRTRWLTVGFRALKSADVLSFAAASILLLYPIIPRSINGSDYFSDRLVLYVWMFAIAGVSINVDVKPEHLRKFRIAAAIVAFGVLAYSDSEFRRIAHQLSKLEHPALLAPGHRGIYIDAPYAPTTSFLNFKPYIWSSARYFRVTESAMLNAPFLGQEHLPLAPGKKLFTSMFSSKVIDYDELPELLLGSQRVRNLVARESDFIIFIGYSGTDPNTVDNVLKRPWSKTWECRRDTWYAICSSREAHSKLAGSIRF